jgi:DNA-binding transcriptional regulator PaaX
LVSYDIPGNLKALRKTFREYLCLWGFFPLHESVLLHAYPCEKQVEFLREYLGVGEYVRIFMVSKIENDRLFRDFFGI